MTQTITVVESIALRIRWEIEAGLEAVLPHRVRPLIEEVEADLLPRLQPSVRFYEEAAVGAEREGAQIPIMSCEPVQRSAGVNIRRCKLLENQLVVSRPNPKRWIYCAADLHRARHLLCNDSEERLAQLIKLSDGREFLIAQHLVKLGPSPKWVEKERANRRKKRSASRSSDSIVFRQFYYGRNGNQEANAEPAIHAYSELSTYQRLHPRFESERTLTYDVASKLKVGDIFSGPRPLFRARDPFFVGLVTPDNDGCNCLTDGWSISIPLSWPNDNWKSQVFDSCRAFAEIGKRFYELRVTHSEGKHLTEIRESLDNESHSVALRRRRQNADEMEEPTIGQCYDGPSEDIKSVGIYEIFFVRVGERLVYYVDSVLYGIGLRAYEMFEDAECWALGGHRRMDLRRRGVKPLWYLAHDPDQLWRENLRRNEDAFRCYQPIPVPFGMFTPKPRRAAKAPAPGPEPAVQTVPLFSVIIVGAVA